MFCKVLSFWVFTLPSSHTLFVPIIMYALVNFFAFCCVLVVYKMIFTTCHKLQSPCKASSPYLSWFLSKLNNNNNNKNKNFLEKINSDLSHFLDTCLFGPYGPEGETYKSQMYGHNAEQSVSSLYTKYHRT